MTVISQISVLVFAAWILSVSAQGISDTSGWALRIKDNCLSGQAECGETAYGFVACCPASSPCINQYNDVCCPPGPNCTDTLVSYGPFCADPSWVLCNNNGYFCCQSGQMCYNEGNTDGCVSPDDTLGPNQFRLDHLEQVQRPLATTSTSAKTSAFAKTSTSAKTSISAMTSTSAKTREPTTTSIASPTIPSSTNPAQNPPSKGLSTSDKIAIGIGVPVGVVTIFGVWITWKMYDYRKQVVAKLLSARGTKTFPTRTGTQNTFPEEYLLSG